MAAKDVIELLSRGELLCEDCGCPIANEDDYMEGNDGRALCEECWWEIYLYPNEEGDN